MAETPSPAPPAEAIRQTVAEMDALLAAEGVRNGVAPEHWATLVQTWVARLQPDGIPKE